MTEEWEIPPELKGPTHNHLRNLLIQIMIDGLVGNDVLEQIGELIAAQARFNRWVAVEGKRTLGTGELLARSTLGSESARGIHAAWAAFYPVREHLEAEGHEERYRELLDALRSSVERFVSACG
ncbi:hypothetical protein [Sphaerisporangium dianthi]|uniref:Uncharacterized protein n=1 Tax=Sphaerisporangium dianthi TaxID=1436120 RepID=A0ABV9C890_9ACTN